MCAKQDVESQPTKGVDTYCTCTVHVPHLLVQFALLCLTGAVPFDADTIQEKRKQ